MFNEDLKDGKAVEREFASRLMKWEVSDIQFSQGKYPERDLKVNFIKDGKEECKTFEIKNDLVSDKTGNVGFEYCYNGKPSGIYTSQADYIVYKLGDKFYYADRIRLIIWLSIVQKELVEGGDNNLSRMFLVKKDVFNSFAHIL